MKRIPLISSIVLFILLCVSSSYWVMRLIKPEIRKVSVPQAAKQVVDVASVSSLFGSVMLLDTNYQLKGVIQANPMNQSVAIIGIDGSPMKAYTINSEINGGSDLSEVFSNYVLLKDHGVSKRVELPNEMPSSQITGFSRSPIDIKPSENRTLNRGKRAFDR